MNTSNVIELDVDKAIRARRAVEEYGGFDKVQLALSIGKIKNRFGGNRVKDVLTLLDNNKLEEVALMLLDYYDKAYAFSKNKYKKRELLSVKLTEDNPSKNASKLIEIANKLHL